jgi:signal transduction histidine kinase
LVWDLCDFIFRRLGENFAQGTDAYLRYLELGIQAVLGQESALSDLPSDEKGSTIARKPEQIESIRHKVQATRECLERCNIDLVVVHFRSRREHPDSPQSTRRILVGPLVAKEHLTSKGLFDRWRLSSHAFDRASENGTLFFRFEAKPAAELTRSKEEFQAGRDEWQPIVHAIAHILDRPGVREIREEDVDGILKQLKEPEQFTRHVSEYAQAHLQRPLHTESELVAFVIESCIVTLTLLARDSQDRRRSVLLAPVFVGSERVGGVSFFSPDHTELQAARRDLKVFARNLLTYLAIQEAHEVEVEKRVLDEISPVTHLFIHTFNKAFTTPILNISDELDGFARQLQSGASISEASSNADRLHAIAVYLRSFSRRWGGAFPALVSPERDNPDTHRPRFVKATDTLLPAEELRQHMKAVYAVSMAQDVFDATDLSRFRNVLSSFSGLDKLVRLTIDLPDRVPGHRDVWCLHLINLMQNALEALPLHDVLSQVRNPPQFLTAEFDLSVKSRREMKGGCGDVVVLEVRDNGCGFRSDILDSQRELLGWFSRTNAAPPNLRDMPKVMRSGHKKYSSKSGESYSSGLVGLADYLSRICRVRWPWDESTAGGEQSHLQKGEILARGSMVPKREDGYTVIELTVPVDSHATAEPEEGYLTGVFFEMRTMRSDI